MKHVCLILIVTSHFFSCTKHDAVKRFSSSTGVAESVFFTYNQDDRPVVVWTEMKGGKLSLFFSESLSNGDFANAKSIPLTDGVATHAEGMPKLAFKKDGTIIAAYEKKTPTEENKYAGAIYYVMSTDNGNSWSKEQYLHSDTVVGRSRSYFDIERLPDGEIGASWLDIKLDKETGGRSVKFARTTKSRGFNSEVLVDSSACQCCRIDVYTDRTENVFVAYRGLKKGPVGRQIRDMTIATSLDGGASFSSPMLISADNWFIDGCPHTGPSLCSNKAGLISLWYTEGTGTGIYFAQKGQEDAKFSSRQLVAAQGRHPQVCANERKVAMVWEEDQKSDDNVKTVIHYKIMDDGAQVSQRALTSITSNSFLPVVCKTADGFLVAYLMENNGDVGMYLTHL